MTTEEMQAYALRHNYYLFKSYYAHQYYGALNWISNSGSPFIKEFTNTEDALDELSKSKILQVRKKLEFLSEAHSSGNQSIKGEIKLFFRKLSLNALRKTVRIVKGRCNASYYKKMAELEWQFSKNKKNGSEMFLVFKKTDG